MLARSGSDQFLSWLAGCFQLTDLGTSPYEDIGEGDGEPSGGPFIRVLIPSL